MEHLTISELIDKLEQFSSDDVLYTSNNVKLVGDYGSYRGYYEDVAFEYTEENKWDDPTFTVGEFLDTVRSAHRSTLHGYKGGEFYCGDDTVCWLSNYRESTGWQIADVVEYGCKVMMIIIDDWEK